MRVYAPSPSVDRPSTATAEPGATGPGGAAGSGGQGGDCDPLGLRGRVAVVTGGSQGIGRAIAGALASFGCRVVIAARREALVCDAVDEIVAAGGDAIGIAGDLRSTPDIAHLLDRAAGHYGGIDTLVNNVGGSFGPDFRRGPLLQLSADDLVNVVRANVVTAFECSCGAVPYLRARGGGSIVNISSVLVRTPMPEFGAYGAAKAALTSLTESMALEWAPEVRVNALLVGHTDTERARRNRSAEQVAWLERHIALGRLGRPADVGGAVAYLASPLSGWVTGAAIPVDGGVRAL